jgi:hypothetical protein
MAAAKKDVTKTHASNAKVMTFSTSNHVRVFGADRTRSSNGIRPLAHLQSRCIRYSSDKSNCRPHTGDLTRF